MDKEKFEKLLTEGRKVLYKTYNGEEREGIIIKINKGRKKNSSTFYLVDNYHFPLNLNFLIGLSL